MTERSAIHSSFVIERTYDATPARVFAAFADPEAKNRWFANGDGWGTDAYQLDFRVGGYEIYRGHARRHGRDLRAPLLRHRRRTSGIVWAYDMHMNDNRISVSLTTIELAPDGDGTRLAFTEHDTFLDGSEAVGPREEGTRELLEALEAELQRP